MTALRERPDVALSKAMHGAKFTADQVIARLRASGWVLVRADDAARLEAALAPDAVVVTVEDVARAMFQRTVDLRYQQDRLYTVSWDESEQRDHWRAEARRILGIDGGQ